MDRYLLGTFLNDSLDTLESNDSFQQRFEEYLKNFNQNPKKFDRDIRNEKLLNDFKMYHGQLQLIIESDWFCQSNTIYVNYIPYINLNINSAVLNIYQITCANDIELFNILPSLKKSFKRKKISFEYLNLYDGTTDQHILKINLTDNEKIDFFYNVIRAIEVELNIFQNIKKGDFI